MPLQQPSLQQHSLGEMFDYASAVIAGEDAASLFPHVHLYVQQHGEEDDHYQTLLALLQREQGGEVEEPPVTPRFDFSYLSPAPAPRPWRIELKKLIVELTDRMFGQFAPPATPQLVYLKSAGEQTILSMSIDEAEKGVKVSIQGRTADVQAAECTVVVGVELANRAWPRLGGIPVVLTNETASAITQLTDAFGRVQFRGIKRTALLSTSIAVGPLDELDDIGYEP